LRPRNMAPSHNPRSRPGIPGEPRRSTEGAEAGVPCFRGQSWLTHRRPFWHCGRINPFPHTPHRYVPCSCAPDALIAGVKVSAVRSRLLPYLKHLSGAPHPRGDNMNTRRRLGLVVAMAAVITLTASLAAQTPY